MISTKYMTVLEIELGVVWRYDPRRYLIIPNIKDGLGLRHEADLILVRNETNYCFEIEIKRTIADLKKDFTKKHGHIDRQNRIKELYYALPTGLLDKAVPIIEENNKNAGIIGCYKTENACLSTHIKYAVPDKNARPLNVREINELTRLGTGKLWSAKRKHWDDNHGQLLI